jgi:hypothetical protein
LEAVALTRQEIIKNSNHKIKVANIQFVVFTATSLETLGAIRRNERSKEAVPMGDPWKE